MNARRKAQMFGGMTLVAATGLMVAAASFAFGPSPVDPYGGTNSGADRSIMLPQGEASGAGRELASSDIMLPQGEASGAGRALAMWPTPVEPNGPNSRTGYTLARSSVVDPDWPKPNSGAGRSIMLPQGEASGAGRELASSDIMLPQGEASGAGRTADASPTIEDPDGPNSGAGRNLA